MTESRAQDLLQAAYDGDTVAPFDYAAERWAADADLLAVAKEAADLVVALRLAKYADEERTMLAPTNAGRYWALNGGFLAFHKEEPDKAAGGRSDRAPEVEALRATYMSLRLKTFWWSFGMSVVGFVLSVVSPSVALSTGERFFHR